MRERISHLHRGRISVVLGLALLITVATGGSASAGSLTPGAVFTETNTTPNMVDAFNRAADGTLTPAGQFATGGNGRTPNPPTATLFAPLDTAGPVELSADGDNRSCLFAVNAGSDTVSSFRVEPDGLVLADQEATNGSRPVSVTSTTRGPGKQLLYVLNSDVGSASIQGYYVSAGCTLATIPGSNEPTSSPDSLPASIRFDQRGRVLAVSERFANGTGDIDIFPVDRKGVAGAPVVTPSTQQTPYGLDWSNQDILSVTNEHFPPPVNTAGSTVATYSLAEDGTLTLLAVAPSPGAACWNLFTNNGRFLYTSNPIGPLNGGANVDAFRVDRDGSMTLVDEQNTPYQSIDNALSHDSRFLYVLSDSLLAAPASAINEYAVNPATGALTPIGSVNLPGNSTSGLAAW